MHPPSQCQPSSSAMLEISTSVTAPPSTPHMACTPSEMKRAPLCRAASSVSNPVLAAWMSHCCSNSRRGRRVTEDANSPMCCVCEAIPLQPPIEEQGVEARQRAETGPVPKGEVAVQQAELGQAEKAHGELLHMAPLQQAPDWQARYFKIGEWQARYCEISERGAPQSDNGRQQARELRPVHVKPPAIQSEPRQTQQFRCQKRDVPLQSVDVRLHTAIMVGGEHKMGEAEVIQPRQR